MVEHDMDAAPDTSPAGQRTAPEGWSPRSWHRRASRPVTVWLVLLLTAGAVHTLIPDYRWVLIHMFTLGAVTNSIVLWSQHLTERFLHRRLSDDARPRQLLRIALLNVGVVVTLVGQVLGEWWERHWAVTQVGALLVGLALVWHAVSLAGQWVRSERGARFRPAALAYVASALCLPVGAVLGALLAMDLRDGLHDRLLLAHTAVNLLGFVGLAAAGSLTVLFPAIWRVRGIAGHVPVALSLLTVGVVVVTAGAVVDSPLLTGGGLLVHLAGWLVSLMGWLHNVAEVLKDPRDRVNYASGSVLLAVLWLVGTLLWLTLDVLSADASVSEVPLPTLPLVVGFAAQLLIGVMSHLLPTTMRGGPAATRAGLKETNRGGLYRLTILNGGLAVWLATEHSWLRVAASLLSLGALAVFLPLIIRAVRAQRKVIMGEAASPREEDPRPAWGQVTAGVATLALLLGLFGGIHGPGGGTTATSGGGDEDVTAVEVVAVEMRFEPEVVEVPVGDRLVVTLRNEGEMAHDLKLATGPQSGRITPGEELEVDLGVITGDVEGWCTIAGHRAQGMVFDVVAVP